MVVELMGRIQPAKDYLLKALDNGKHIVTVSKDLVALHGTEIQKKQVTRTFFSIMKQLLLVAFQYCEP